MKFTRRPAHGGFRGKMEWPSVRLSCPSGGPLHLHLKFLLQLQLKSHYISQTSSNQIHFLIHILPTTSHHLTSFPTFSISLTSVSYGGCNVQSPYVDFLMWAQCGPKQPANALPWLSNRHSALRARCPGHPGRARNRRARHGPKPEQYQCFFNL